jgi:hypothetical protein
VFVHARTLIEESLLFFLLEHYNQLGDPSSGIFYQCPASLLLFSSRAILAVTID